MAKGQSVDARGRRQKSTGALVVSKRGRRSLSGEGETPQIKVRVPVELQQRARRVASAEGKTLSDLTREALAHRLAGERREVVLQRELHCALLGKLLDTGIEPYREVIHRNLRRAREHVRGGQAERWLDEWSALVDGPPSRLVDVFLGNDEHSIDMRQMSPFAGVLSDEERAAAIDRARGHAPV